MGDAAFVIPIKYEHVKLVIEKLSSHSRSLPSTVLDLAMASRRGSRCAETPAACVRQRKKLRKSPFAVRDTYGGRRQMVRTPMHRA